MNIQASLFSLCTDQGIAESYDMAFECYRQMIELYGAGNVSTCGFSSGGALAIGIALHNNGRRFSTKPGRCIPSGGCGAVTQGRFCLMKRWKNCFGSILMRSVFREAGEYNLLPINNTVGKKFAGLWSQRSVSRYVVWLLAYSYLTLASHQRTLYNKNVLWINQY